MSEAAWQVLTTLPDVPSAQSLAALLAGEGLTVRVSSDAGVLGQAAPARIYVAAGQLHRARYLLAQQQFSDEELAALANEPGPRDP
jgi:hypothetical protein